MAMVSADGSSQSFGGLTAQIGWFGLRVGGHSALSLHSSNEPGELSQWLCHDDSTINIVVVIIIIIIIIITQLRSGKLNNKAVIDWLTDFLQVAYNATQDVKCRALPKVMQLFKIHTCKWQKEWQTD